MSPYKAIYDFEQSLLLDDKLKITLNSTLAKKLEFIFFYLSSDSDQMLSEHSYSDEYLNYLYDIWGICGREKLAMSSDLDMPSWWIKNCDLEFERKINSKKELALFCRRYGHDSEFPFLIPGVDDIGVIEQTVRELQFNKWIIKHEYGHSGKWIRVFKKTKLLEHLYEIDLSGCIIEPYVKRVRDYGILINQNGYKIYHSYSYKNGGFCGAVYNYKDSNDRELLKTKFHLKKMRSDIKEYFEYDKFQKGKKEKIQLDCFDYVNESGQIKTRILCELNHRHTMVDLMWFANNYKKNAIGTEYFSGLFLLSFKGEFPSFEIIYNQVTKSNNEESMAFPLCDGAYGVLFVWLASSKKSILFQKLKDVVGNIQAKDISSIILD